MATHIALLTVFDVFMVPVAHHHRFRMPARETGAKPKAPPAARTTFRDTNSRDNPRSMLREARSVRVLRRP
jgi:hypothetical protein